MLPKREGEMDKNVRGRIDSKGKYEKVSANDVSATWKYKKKMLEGGFGSENRGTSFDRNGRARVLLKRKHC